MDDRRIRVDDLSEIRRRIVVPVVGSLIGEDELEELEVRSDAPEVDWAQREQPGSVWVRVTARGESFRHQLVAPAAAFRSARDDPDYADWDGTLVAEDMAYWLYDQLWDWVVETRFAWGDDREGEYEIPLPL